VTTRERNNSGQALLEVALIVPVLAIFIFGIVDYGRAIYDAEVIDNLSGEGSSMASRGTTLANTVTAVLADSDLNMSSLGCVIVSSVSAGANPNTFTIASQAQSAVCNSATSRVGCYPPPSSCGSATVPASIQTILQTSPSSTIYITEVFYNFKPVTPLGAFLGNSNLLPAQLYSVAYY
jgi:Flp pilus assembly protein TadG